MRVAFRLSIKPGQRNDYIAQHANVWPELLRDLTAAGFRNYTIFNDGDDLFGYYECDDSEATNASMAASDANRRWQAFMSDFLESSPDPDAGPTLLMTEIFRLE